MTDDNQTDGIPVTFPVLVVEGLATSDGRYIEPGSLTTRPLPLPILAQTQTPVGGGGHDGAHVIGRLDHAERVPGPTVVSKVTGQPFPEGTFVWRGSGFIDPTHEVADLVSRGYLTGNSVDLSEVEAFVEDDPDYVEEIEPQGMKIAGRGPDRMRLTKGTIAATTLVAIPAFADGHVLVNGQAIPPAEGLVAAATPPWRAADLGDTTCLPCAAQGATSATARALVAGMVAVDGTLPPIAWFRDPELPTATPLTIDDDGRVYGHLAEWNTCHTSYANQCVLAPKSACDYAYFRTGARRVLDDDGEPTQIGIGKLTVVLNADDDGHAGGTLSAMPAAAHYDNVATAVADVEVGEDRHGIWVAGAVRPTATPEQVDALRASTLSGDWRPVNGGRLELVAALGVNTPGFPIARARVASGAVQSLVAAGAVRQPTQLSADQDTLATAIARKVARQLGIRLPAEPADTGTDGLAARRAAVLAAMEQEELSARRAEALGLFDWDEFAPDDADIEFARRNWVSKAGGLPKYIKRIKNHLEAKGMDESRAIATAVNVVKKMCATGDINFPGKQKVNAGSQAEACAAVADWERKKAQS